jgi:hypothetical protein
MDGHTSHHQPGPGHTELIRPPVEDLFRALTEDQRVN